MDKVCPNCDNKGTTSVHAPNCNCDSIRGAETCPIAEQCEFCYTAENSKFNLVKYLSTNLSTWLVEKKEPK